MGIGRLDQYEPRTGSLYSDRRQVPAWDQGLVSNSIFLALSVNPVLHVPTQIIDPVCNQQCGCGLIGCGLPAHDCNMGVAYYVTSLTCPMEQMSQTTPPSSYSQMPNPTSHDTSQVDHMTSHDYKSTYSDVCYDKGEEIASTPVLLPSKNAPREYNNNLLWKPVVLSTVKAVVVVFRQNGSNFWVRGRKSCVCRTAQE